MTQNHRADRPSSEPTLPERLLGEHFAAINDGDLERVRDIHATDVVVHSPRRELDGIEEVLASWRAQLDAVPDLTDTVEELVATADRAAVQYTTTGTHEGEFLGIEPTGERVAITSMAMVRVEEDEIVEWWNHPDELGLLVQLGAVDPPT